MVEEPAHAAAATPRTTAMIAVEAERVTAVVFVGMAAPVAAVMMMSSKHVCLRSYFVISK
jgi:hypothetical protein